MYLRVDRTPIARPDHRAGLCPHEHARERLHLRFVAGVRAAGRVRQVVLENYGGVRACCAADRADPLARADFWHGVSFGTRIPDGADALDVAWLEPEARDAAVAAVVPRPTPAEEELLQAYHALRERCPKWKRGCGGRAVRCEVCARPRWVQRVRDLERVRAGLPAWRAERVAERAQQEREHAERVRAREAQEQAARAEHDAWARLRAQWEAMFGAGSWGGSGRANDAPPVVAAAAVLGVAWPCDRAAVLRAHRRKILADHPDRGGDTTAAARVNAARDVLLRACA